MKKGRAIRSKVLESQTKQMDKETFQNRLPILNDRKSKRKKEKDEEKGVRVDRPKIDRPKIVCFWTISNF